MTGDTCELRSPVTPDEWSASSGSPRPSALAHSCREIISFVDRGTIGFYEKCGFVRSAAPDAEDSSAVMTKRFDPPT
jgi:hypothetical protein